MVVVSLCASIGAVEVTYRSLVVHLIQLGKFKDRSSCILLKNGSVNIAGYFEDIIFLICIKYIAGVDFNGNLYRLFVIVVICGDFMKICSFVFI